MINNVCHVCYSGHPKGHANQLGNWHMLTSHGAFRSHDQAILAIHYVLQCRRWLSKAGCHKRWHPKPCNMVYIYIYVCVYTACILYIVICIRSLCWMLGASAVIGNSWTRRAEDSMKAFGWSMLIHVDPCWSMLIQPQLEVGKGRLLSGRKMWKSVTFGDQLQGACWWLLMCCCLDSAVCLNLSSI